MNFYQISLSLTQANKNKNKERERNGTLNKFSTMQGAGSSSMCLTYSWSGLKISNKTDLQKAIQYESVFTMTGGSLKAPGQ